jgi:PAS domain S-box-containing protein
MACERIHDLDVPAYIKDSQLRYVAVNAAYARFFDLSIEAFRGQTTFALFARPEDEDREDKERRALVFGSEETAICFERAGPGRYHLEIERFLTEDDRVLVYGVFAERPVVVAALPAVAETQQYGGLLLDAFDLLDVGIAMYNERDELVYCNAGLAGYYHSLDLEMKPGLTLRAVMERSFDYGLDNDDSLYLGPNSNREAWISERLEAYARPYSEFISQLSEGRWLRGVNKRLDNGFLLCLRVDVSDFKVQEQQLRRHISDTNLFRAMLEELPVPVFLRDSERRLTYANAAYEQMLGGDRDRFLGLTEEEMFPSAARRFRMENVDVLARGEAIEKSEDVMFADGRKVPAITRLARIVTPEDEAYIVGSIADVSLLKTRENQLIEAQGQAEKLHRDLETILHLLPVGVLILDADFVIEYANDAFENLWHLDRPQDLVGRPYRKLVETNYLLGTYKASGLSLDEIYQQRLDKFLSDDEIPTEVESNGGKVLIITSKRLSDGKYLLTYFDMTALRRRDQEISEAREQLERLGAFMQDATRVMSQGLVVIEDGLIILSNESLPRMLDMPAHMLAEGEKWQSCFEYCADRGDFGPEPLAEMTLWLDSARRARPFSRSFRAAGTTWLQMEATVSGRGHWLVVFTDVTEMKQREEELTRLLLRAEAADCAKSEFLANMSHEIRTPMNGVLGMAELLARSDLDPRQKTFTDIIVKSGNALMTIINDILDFSKIDAGQMTLRKAVFDPVEAIEDVATLLSSPAAEKDIELIVRGDASTRQTVMGDAGRFRQIITNLVGNAVKFTEKGHIFIDLSATPLETGEVSLTVRIEDTGIGIPEDKLQLIFEKFSQVDASTTRRHEGTGLGLSITAGLVTLFGGTMTVESQAGVGSVFSVTLPLPMVRHRQNVRTLPVNVQDARVLVIDDNAVNRRIIGEQLDIWGFDGFAVSNGWAGLQMLDEAAKLGVVVDAIVLDYHMPDMNGVEVAQRIRADRRFDDIAIIFLTSMDMAGEDSMFAGLNVQAHLMKPARAALLRSTIIDVVRATRIRGQVGGDHGYQVETACKPAADVVSISRLTETPLSPDVTAAAGTGRLDVLVAEDNEVNQIVFTQILQATDLSFLIVSDGSQAVGAWQTHDPAVILMDVSMPVMNGHEATRTIRTLELAAADGRHVPIVGVTAHALESDRDLCMAAGMDDYLAKPISPELLEGKLELWLKPARPFRRELRSIQ